MFHTVFGSYSMCILFVLRTADADLRAKRISRAIVDKSSRRTQLAFFSWKTLAGVCLRIQERLEMEAKLQSEEKELDYLEPFLAQLNTDDMQNGKLTRQQAYKLREDCLANLKQRLIDRANLIQARFEKVKFYV
jgi:hypothetical protein